MEKEKRYPSIEKRHIKNQVYVQENLLDLNLNHNWSLYREIYERNKNNLDKVAILYRGRKIKYCEMFDEVEKLAKSLRTNNIQKNDEIPVCMSNTPEFIYLLLAASKVGAKLNIFGADFNKDYINEILDGCTSKLIFVTDDLYSEIRDNIDCHNFENIVVSSLADSLINGVDPYYELDKEYKDFSNKTSKIKSNNKEIKTYFEYVDYGKDFKGITEVESGINDEFTTTYSSGSTKLGLPKAIIHKNRIYTSMARFHDKDLSRLPETKDLIILASIPTHSNTVISCAITDSLCQSCTVACEPIYDKNFFIDSLIINKPNFAPATKSFWLNGMKKIETETKYKNLKLPFLVISASVGEMTSPNEEKYINSVLKKVNAGSDIVKPLKFAPLSIGGGDCEHGGLFFTIFKSLMEKLQLGKQQKGMVPFQLADIAILNEKGEECSFNEYGRLVANSPCTMSRYKNNEEATKNFFIKDAYGRTWADCKVYSCIDNYGNVHMKGRMGNEYILKNGKKIPEYEIADVVLKDTKNILSCEVVYVNDNFGELVPIVHIEFQPNRRKSISTILLGCQNRCNKMLPSELSSKLLFRIHSFDEGFALTGCGKRNVLSLEEEGINKKCIDINKLNNCEIGQKNKVKVKN